MSKRLVVLAGPDEGRSFPLGSDALLLGRSRATEGRLIDPHVSQVHCQVSSETEGLVLTDFDSEGGTFVNGKKVTRHVLQPGDIVRIGATRLQFAEDASVPANAAATPQSASKSNWAKDLVGQELTNYKVGPILAKGKTSTLFHGNDTRKKQSVVLKVLNPEYGETDAKVHRFVDAMKATMPLKHPNLLRIYGAGKTGAHCWLAGEYFRGESLAAVIGRHESSGMLDWREVLKVGTHLARALDYAHSKKILHLNVTPQNILAGANFKETKLTDLALANALEGDPTRPISAAGVPSEDLAYMPPERTDGPGKPVDARADIYSLGATLYAMLTGKPPLEGNSVDELVNKIRLESPVRLRTLQLGVPEGFELIIHKMLAKRAEDRYQSAKELVKELDRFAASYNVPV